MLTPSQRASLNRVMRVTARATRRPYDRMFERSTFVKMAGEVLYVNQTEIHQACFAELPVMAFRRKQKRGKA